MKTKYPQAYDRYRRHATKIQNVFKVLTNKPIEQKPAEGKKYYMGFMQAFKDSAETLTNYERQKGLYITKITKPVDLPDIKLVMRETSDGQKSLILYFKTSVKYDTWNYWLPSRDQFKFLIEQLPVIIKEVEAYNSKYWGQPCKNENKE